MIIIIDNYDSFTYNLFQYVKKYYDDVIVLKNNDKSLMEINLAKTSSIILSPGPGKPSEAGLMPKIIKKYYKSIPILGICLGHQSIVETFGGEIHSAKNICHGKVYQVKHFSNCILFKGIEKIFNATRYHSLVSSNNIPDCLEVTAKTKIDNEIMGVKHKKYPVFGLQFHPESIETPHGLRMIKNFIYEV